MIMGSEFSFLLFFFPPFDSAACYGWLFAGRWGCNSHLCSPFLPPLYLMAQRVGKGLCGDPSRGFCGLQVMFKCPLFFYCYFSSRLQQMPNRKFFRNGRDEWQMQNTFSIFTTRTWWVVCVMPSVPLLDDPGWTDFCPFTHLCNSYPPKKQFC